MSIMEYLFRGNRSNKNSASIAKERLQIIVSHERSSRGNSPDYLPLLREELIRVISKYVDIDHDQVKVELERSGNCSILELNITLPDSVMAE
jgi:cell division topological specificity factor